MFVAFSQIIEVRKKYILSDNEETKISGVGLGLSTAKALVEACGGNIYIKSKENVGTKITFSVKVCN